MELWDGLVGGVEEQEEEYWDVKCPKTKRFFWGQGGDAYEAQGGGDWAAGTE